MPYTLFDPRRMHRRSISAPACGNGHRACILGVLHSCNGAARPDRTPRAFGFVRVEALRISARQIGAACERGYKIAWQVGEGGRTVVGFGAALELVARTVKQRTGEAVAHRSVAQRRVVAQRRAVAQEVVRRIVPLPVGALERLQRIVAQGCAATHAHVVVRVVTQRRPCAVRQLLARRDEVGVVNAVVRELRAVVDYMPTAVLRYAEVERGAAACVAEFETGVQARVLFLVGERKAVGAVAEPRGRVDRNAEAGVARAVACDVRAVACEVGDALGNHRFDQASRK